VHHIALRATDLGRLRRFYGETLGFPIVLEGAEGRLYANVAP
jgi:catechol 2,3-dioxygenase-like lactoylglutathione lyase family enzyme